MDGTPRHSPDRRARQRHRGARAMRGRSYTVGVAIVELTSPFQAEVAQGIGDELEQTPYQDIIVTSRVRQPSAS
jgi:LacI family transcriptional regulator, galactose operon repressor